MKDFWPLFVWLGWMIFCVWFWRRRAQSQQSLVDDAWSELARRTGLSYNPGSGARLLGGIAVARKKPSIRGGYRGRPLLLTIVGECVSLYDGVVWIAHTRVWMKIRNHAGCSLIVREKGLLARTFRKGKSPSETLAIDPRFSVKGRPPEFIQRAIGLIGSLSQDRPTMQINESPFFWTSHSRSPMIKLKGSDLVWQQYDVLTDASELITLLNQLSDLAYIIEEMGVKFRHKSREEKPMNTTKTITLLSLLIGALLTACGPSPAEQAGTATQVAANIFATQTAQAPTATPTFTPSPTATPTATPTPTSTPTPTPTTTPTPTLTPAPVLSSVRLTLDDLPAGFEAMPADELREMEQAYPEGASAFGFQDDRRSQVAMGILMPYPARADQAMFDSMMPQIVHAMAAALGADTNSEPLPGLEETGEARVGITAVATMGNLSVRWDIVAFRRSEVGVLLFIAYPDGDKPAVPMVDLAGLLDERIQNFLTVNPSSSNAAADFSNPSVFPIGLVTDLNKIADKYYHIG